MPSAQGAARSCRSPPRPRSRASPSASSSRPASAAHMFVFYYAVLSEVSPPVALSPFAASAITGGNPYKTMMLTWKYALPCFLVPFMFTQPDGIAILWRGVTFEEAAVASVSAIAGIVALVSGVGGYLLRTTTLVERVLLVGAGL